MKIHLSLISFAAMLKILNSVCCARALCSQPSTATLPRAKRPTQPRAPSRRVPARADLHSLAGEAFHSLISTTRQSSWHWHSTVSIWQLRSSHWGLTIDILLPPAGTLPSHHKVLCNTGPLQPKGLTSTPFSDAPALPTWLPGKLFHSLQ